MPPHRPRVLPEYQEQSPWPVYVAFFASGVSGLIYQVVWVRVFAHVFGNTIHSASLVVAVFMLGLGLGSHLVGAWADRRYARQPGSLLRVYGQAEIAIALLASVLSLAAPHLGPFVASVSSYAPDLHGWYVPSTATYFARLLIAAVMLLPITVLMGGTLTLLVRHLVHHDLSIASSRIGALYAVNTAGAALGCFLTDIVLVPAVGLLRTQLTAVALNVAAGVAAFAIASAARRSEAAYNSTTMVPARPVPDGPNQSEAAVALAGSALALTGFGALGMEILWFRHATILLGGFRAVFALLLTVVLGGIAAGGIAGGVLSRRTQHPARWLMSVQAMFAVAAITGIVTADAGPIEAAARLGSGGASAIGEVWFNLRPVLLLAGIPSILMGTGFPLANALVQRAEFRVARRAGGLYFANTAGAVFGSIVTGFVLLPWLGIQASAATLAAASALAMVPLFACTRFSTGVHAAAAVRRTDGAFFAASLAAAGSAVAACLLLPPDLVIRRAVGEHEIQHVLTQQEGLTEVVTITEPGDGRLLLTNGHAMSSTARLSQRYMRALAHIPLLMMDDPASVLVIGFGVGNTTHAATLHPSVRLVEVADLSRNILEHASYFDEGNHGVLTDARVRVFVNDGRQHLRTRPAATYDLITLEPPPIAYAGVAALYSREFYELARSRLTSRGYVSQWLPTYQVPTTTALSMIRAFVDVFPRSVLLSGAQADLLLLGTTAPSIDLDPARVADLLTSRPAVASDLSRLDFGTVREIAGSFVGSSRMMQDATRSTPALTDDWPLTEHSVLSALDPGQDVPAAVVDLNRLAEWCPRCFSGGEPVPVVAGLDLYVHLLALAYRASPADAARLAGEANGASGRRVVAGSAYLGAIVPESAELYNLVGVYRASHGAMHDAIEAFRKALQVEPDSAQSHWHLGAALASAGAREEALVHLQRSVELDPSNKYAQDDLEALTRAARQQ